MYLIRRAASGIVVAAVLLSVAVALPAYGSTDPGQTGECGGTGLFTNPIKYCSLEDLLLGGP